MPIIKLILILLFNIPYGDICVFEPDMDNQNYSIELHYTQPNANARKIVTEWKDLRGRDNKFVDFVEEHNISKLEAFFWTVVLERDKQHLNLSDNWKPI